MGRLTTYYKVRAALHRSLLRRPSHYALLADRSWTVSPLETKMERAAIFLDGELDRVRGVQEETTLEAELARVREGPRQHAETRAYLFKDVTLLSGRLFKGPLNHRMSQLSEEVGAAEEVDMPLAAIASTLMGSIYFGHWMHDDVVMSLAAQALGPAFEVARKRYFHEDGYRHLLGLTPRQVARGRFRELILLDDWGQNADKRRRYHDMRTRFRRSAAGVGNERIYIKRGSAGAARGRDLLNAPELEAHLISEGFAVVDPDTMTAQQIATMSMDAKLVVGVEGSHLAHAIFPIAHDGTLVVMQPPKRFNNVYKDLTDALGLQYAFAVGETAEHGFVVEPARLSRLFELIASGRR
ncbi:MAG: glycosyltransferase family 61 protein [Pseudomonadota bacterium]|nr:glycosyltransferase family 61 protein [Pseudomonadota bacterium]